MKLWLGPWNGCPRHSGRSSGCGTTSAYPSRKPGGAWGARRRPLANCGAAPSNTCNNFWTRPMNPANDPSPDEEFPNPLAAYDEALGTGRPPRAAGTATPPHLAERLERAQACLRRLERDRLQTDALA